MLVLGCLVLGTGVAMLLTADLGSDGYSTLVNGVSKATDISFLLANTLISLLFLLVAAVRRVYPGLGTIVQVVVVGWTVSYLIDVLDTPDDLAVAVRAAGGGVPRARAGHRGVPRRQHRRRPR